MTLKNSHQQVLEAITENGMETEVKCKQLRSAPFFPIYSAVWPLAIAPTKPHPHLIDNQTKNTVPKKLCQKPYKSIPS